MPCRVRVDPSRRLVLSYVYGTLTLADIIWHRAHLRQDRHFTPDLNQIMSFEDISAAGLSADDVREMAVDAIFNPGTRRALIVAADLTYGLARIFAAHRELKGEPNIRVVRTLADAAEWVGADLAFVQQAFEEMRNEQPLA